MVTRGGRGSRLVCKGGTIARRPLRATKGELMRKYVLLYSAGQIPIVGPARDKLMQAWRDWVNGLDPAVIDRGNPFGSSMTIAVDGLASDADASGVKGYMIFTANSLAAATELARNCPHRTTVGGSIEIYETIPID